MNRLYVELKAEMDALNADFELLLVNASTELTELEEKCEHANIILLTVLPCGNEYGCDYLKMLEYRKTVIALTDPFLSDFCNYVALDNRAVGRLAGKDLLAAGCRRPVFINGSTYNTIFRKRYEGIREFMKEAGVSFPAYSFQPRSEHFQEIRRMELLDALAAGHDGAFIASDEGIDYITHDLFEQGLVPERFKLITLHGSGEALCCPTPIACVNHAITGHLYDPEKRLLFDGIAPDGTPVSTSSPHAAAWGILLGLLPEDHDIWLERILLPLLKGNRKTELLPSSYFMYYIFEAVKRMGHGGEVIDCIRRWWGEFVDGGCSATPENWLERMRRGYWSMCHAWSAHPLVHFSDILLGVRQVSPGWCSIVSAPLVTPGEKLSGSVPTPFGPVHATWDWTGAEPVKNIQAPPEIRVIQQE